VDFTAWTALSLDFRSRRSWKRVFLFTKISLYSLLFNSVGRIIKISPSNWLRAYGGSFIGCFEGLWSIFTVLHVLQARCLGLIFWKLSILIVIKAVFFKRLRLMWLSCTCQSLADWIRALKGAFNVIVVGLRGSTTPFIATAFKEGFTTVTGAFISSFEK